MADVKVCNQGSTPQRVRFKAHDGQTTCGILPRSYVILDKDSILETDEELQAKRIAIESLDVASVSTPVVPVVVTSTNEPEPEPEIEQEVAQEVAQDDTPVESQADAPVEEENSTEAEGKDEPVEAVSEQVAEVAVEEKPAPVVPQYSKPNYPQSGRNPNKK